MIRLNLSQKKNQKVNLLTMENKLKNLNLVSRKLSPNREKQSNNYKSMLLDLQLLSTRLLLTKVLGQPFRRQSKSNTAEMYRASNRHKGSHRIRIINLLKTRTQMLLKK